MSTQAINGIEFTRIKNDVNGNPRYVVHYLNFISKKDEEVVKSNFSNRIDIEYTLAIKKANSIGGRKYHTKSFGGGIVFQSYNIHDLASKILALK